MNVNTTVNQFKAAVRASFQNVKMDLDEVKKSVTDWILYLDSNQRNLQLRVAELEKEIKELKRQKQQIVEVY